MLQWDACYRVIGLESAIAGLERRVNKQKQAEQLKQGRGKMYMLQSIDTPKKSQNPKKTRNVPRTTAFPQDVGLPGGRGQPRTTRSPY